VYEVVVFNYGYLMRYDWWKYVGEW